MEYRKLGNTGLKVSVLGFGASSLGGVFHQVDPEACVKTVWAALDGGINFFDVSPAYGETLAETNLGIALKGIARDRYYLATKVGSYSEAKGDYDYSAARTEHSLHDSLARLGVDYVDLIQCHDIEFADHDQIVNETLPTLHRLKQKGLARFVGITGLPLRVFPSILDKVGPNIVDTILSFCHYELNDDSLAGLIPYLSEKGVGIINASPTGMGLLTPQGAPPWHPASKVIIDGCRNAVEYCRKRGIDIVKLAIQFSCSQPNIATTLVSTARPSNIQDNIAYAEQPADESLLAELLEILKPIHNFNFTRGRLEHRDVLVGPVDESNGSANS
ncbi:MAG: aldo/keto reductase [Verrucomicrobia bacterium]|nr:aldo/keto reductase [Verrucomicrobiota bacterium]